MSKDIIGSFFGASQSHFRPFFTSKRVKSTAIGSRRPRRSKRRGKRPVGAHRRGARLLARKRPSDRSTDADQLTRAGPGSRPAGSLRQSTERPPGPPGWRCVPTGLERCTHRGYSNPHLAVILIFPLALTNVTVPPLSSRSTLARPGPPGSSSHARTLLASTGSGTRPSHRTSTTPLAETA